MSSGTDTSSTRESAAPQHEQEARLLAELLRTSRLALLFAEAGSDKTSLLKHDLMPLLRRRSGDRSGPATARESGVVVPFPDRRGRPATRAARRRTEIVIHFDAWSDAPLQALHACLHDAASTTTAERTAPRRRLADTLEALSSRLDTRFFILLDRFEEFLRNPQDRESIGEFTNELVDAINQPNLAANFLIAIDDESRPRLAGLASRIPGFDDCSLKLARPRGSNPPAAPHEPAALVPTQQVDEPTWPTLDPIAPAAPQPAPVKKKAKAHRTPPPRVPIKTEDVYAFIEQTLSHTATDFAEESFPADMPVQSAPAPRRAEPLQLTAPPHSPRAAPRRHGVPHRRRPLTLRAALKWVVRRLRALIARYH
ncbi:MAG: hypothetical protein E6H65_02570 [Betaproteobacteria bacterium]|nr:MAG: hypothetical protein E6H65_02570 [Betaproteobacteria bacterium]